MTIRTVYPGSVSGTIAAPPSKSYTHRALVVGALAGRRYTVEHALRADDTLTTAQGLRSLGFAIDPRGPDWVVRPRIPLSRRASAPRIDCRRSGTTLRFLTALASCEPTQSTFVGDAELVRRPMGPLLEVLRTGGVRVSAARTPSGLPFRLQGPLQPLRARLRMDVSSQFLSALLLVLPTLAQTSVVTFAGRPVSSDYLRATVRVLAVHGVRCQLGVRRAEVAGGQRFRGDAFRVPGDASSAAYLWAAAAATGGTVRVRGIDRRWPQADLAILPILRKMGARVRLHSDGATVEGRTLGGVDVDLSDAPDLYPLVAVLASLAAGSSMLRGAAHVVFKESDRRAAALALVRKLGAQARLRPGRLRIDGRPDPKAIRMEGNEDHRVVMAATVGALAGAGPSWIGHAEAVAKSFPAFFACLGRLGAPTERAA